MPDTNFEASHIGNSFKIGSNSRLFERDCSFTNIMNSRSGLETSLTTGIGSVSNLLKTDQFNYDRNNESNDNNLWRMSSNISSFKRIKKSISQEKDTQKAREPHHDTFD